MTQDLPAIKIGRTLHNVTALIINVIWSHPCRERGGNGATLWGKVTAAALGSQQGEKPILRLPWPYQFVAAVPELIHQFVNSYPSSASGEQAWMGKQIAGDSQ